MHRLATGNAKACDKLPAERARREGDDLDRMSRREQFSRRAAGEATGLPALKPLQCPAPAQKAVVDHPSRPANAVIARSGDEAISWSKSARDRSPSLANGHRQKSG